MEKEVEAKLILEDGSEFKGYAFGYIKETIGEIIFNTAMTGYEEILTDLSYTGQLVVMTYPLIGNYGINLDDKECETPHLSGIIVSQKCDEPNNFRTEMTLDGYLKQNKIMGMYGIDTRALTKLIRNNGTLKGIITTNDTVDLKQKFDNFTMKNVVAEVTTKEKYEMHGNGKHVALLDFGLKENIIRSLSQLDYKITVLPAFTTVDEVMEINPDIILLSNGPGDPEDLPSVIDNVKELIKLKPTYGICLGHQLIALATGCATRRMRYGHHGGNHAVKNLETGKIYMTSQNHEYVVETLSDEMEVSYINVNDKSIEGIKHKTLPVWSVQFHPEASPGPLDVSFLFQNMEV